MERMPVSDESLKKREMVRSGNVPVAKDIEDTTLNVCKLGCERLFCEICERQIRNTFVDFGGESLSVTAIQENAFPFPLQEANNL